MLLAIDEKGDTDEDEVGDSEGEDEDGAASDGR